VAIGRLCRHWSAEIRNGTLPDELNLNAPLISVA